MLNILGLDKLCRGSMIFSHTYSYFYPLVDRNIAFHVPFVVEVVNVVHAFDY